MRAPLGWLREHAALPADLTGRQLAAGLVRAGLEVETVEEAGADVTGPLVVGVVLAYEVEEHSNGKRIRWCSVDVGEPEPRGIVCGAHNFEVGDVVVVALPGAVLPGNFAISARKTYGHVSDGMICSARELGIGDDHSAILVLTEEGLTSGQDAGPVLHLRDDVLDIAVTPDRGYCLSIRGLGRESAAALGVAFRDPVARPVPEPVKAGYPVRLEAAACPLFVALTVTHVSADRPSPRWLAQRLQLAGMRPISLTVDVTNYVMLETGQPIHGYDRERLSGPIVVRHAGAGEKLTTLDDVIRPLEPADLLITDDSGPIGLAGVMGGATTELSSATTDIVIEAAHFDAMTIARASRRHKLSSEASRRFERGVDPAATYAAAHRVAELLVELGGGTLAEEETVVGSVPALPATTLASDLPARVLGADIDADQATGFLRAVGVDVEQTDGTLAVSPPTWRPDLRDPYDYVEEIGRLYGYEDIPAAVPQAPVGRGLTRAQRDRRAITAAAVAAGYVEVLSLPFAAAEDLDRLGLAVDDARRNLVRIANPLADTSPFLRSTLLPGLFAAVTRNTSRSNDDLALFEAGSVFFAPQPAVPAPRPGVAGRPTEEELVAMDRALPDQPRHLAAVLTGFWAEPGWTGPGERAGWRQAMALVEAVAAAVGVEVTRAAAQVAPWHPGRCARFALAGGVAPLGHAGELHPEVCRSFGLPARTAAVEIDLDALLAAAPERGSVANVSPYPVVKEDVALVVDETVAAGDVALALVRGGGELLESLRLFDVYTGPQIGDGKKSLAFALRFRAADRTLTEAEAGAARDAAVAAAAAEFGAQQRTE
jgi:phenylalanyl-tRNA synthetase beta chain